MWAGGKPELKTPHAFCQIVMGLSDRAFWARDHQRDLLFVLARRWNSLNEKSRKRIEDRLLGGPAKWDGEDEHTYQKHRTLAVLDRVQWLRNHKCDFSFDVEAEIAKRRKRVPNWTPASAELAADSLGIRSGCITTDTEHATLLREPIESLLSTARSLSGPVEGNTFEERDPFSGLCAERPARAYLALARAARRNDYPKWAWETFLRSSGREQDGPRFSATIAERLCRIPDEALTRFLYASTSWVQKVSKSLSKERPKSLDKAILRLIDAVTHRPTDSRSPIIGTTRGRDWATEGLNSPVGDIARAILEDSRVAASHDGGPSANWLQRLARILALDGDPRRHAIAIISHDLGWLHRLAPNWTEHHLLSVLDAEDVEDRAALWAGFFWNPRITSKEFYFRLQPDLFSLAKERTSLRERHVQGLASLVLWGWIAPRMENEERHVSNAEFRDVLLHGGGDLRSHILWRIERGLTDREESSRKQFSTQVLEFFRDVWPRQKVAKNSAMSLCLVKVLLSSGKCLPELADVVLPLLTKVNQGRWPALHFRDEVRGVIDQHPVRFLAMLHTILPDQVASWPYDTGDVLEKIAEADSDLLSEKQFRELKRKWDAR